MNIIENRVMLKQDEYLPSYFISPHVIGYEDLTFAGAILANLAPGIVRFVQEYHIDQLVCWFKYFKIGLKYDYVKTTMWAFWLYIPMNLVPNGNRINDQLPKLGEILMTKVKSTKLENSPRWIRSIIGLFPGIWKARRASYMKSNYMLFFVWPMNDIIIITSW